MNRFTPLKVTLVATLLGIDEPGLVGYLGVDGEVHETSYVILL